LVNDVPNIRAETILALILGRDLYLAISMTLVINCLGSHGSFPAISGLYFIEKNSSYIMDEKCSTPLGFNIIFPSMIRLGIDLGLELPLKQSDIDGIFRLQEIELRQRFATAYMKIFMPTACIF
jgi:hypothetical protein